MTHDEYIQQPEPEHKINPNTIACAYCDNQVLEDLLIPIVNKAGRHYCCQECYPEVKLSITLS